MVINETTSYCCECRQSHRAAVKQNGGHINFHVDCPRGIKSTMISSDAGIFLRLRKKYERDTSAPSIHNGKKWFHLLEITDECNFKCPVCYADAGAGHSNISMALEAALENASRVKKSGGKVVTLTGGEPTLHPALPAMIKKISGMGLKVEIATNGMKIAEDVNYARILKRSGLQRAWLQLDTFNEDIHMQMRGNKCIPQKKTAARHIVSSGLRLGIIVTVTSLNINGIDAILEYGLTLGPKLDFIVFQVAAPAGRYQLPQDTLIDREAVIKKLMNSGILHKESPLEDCFWPIPYFRPWQLEVHPDCAAVLFLLINGGIVTPIDCLVDMRGLYQRLSANTMRPNFFTRNIVPLFYVLRLTSVVKMFDLIQFLYGFITGKGKKRMLVISVDSFLGADYQDEQRLARCANSHVTSCGLISPCVYNYPDKRRQNSRENWRKNGAYE